MPPRDIYYCLTTCKLFNVLNHHQLNIIKNTNSGWRYCTKNGLLDSAKLVYKWSIKNNKAINIHTHNECVFRQICANDYLEMRKWFYKLTLGINTNRQHAFKYSCMNRHIEINKWLYELSIGNNDPINIHTQNKYTFKSSCANGHFEISK